MNLKGPRKVESILYWGHNMEGLVGRLKRDILGA